MSTLNHIKRLHRIIERSLFEINPPLAYDRVTTALERLANWVFDYPGDSDELWSIGECGCCDLGSLLVGAYWYYADNHNGQWSDEYRTLCALGTVYNPGPICNGPQEDSPEQDVYNQLADCRSND